jgi:hypothetical protein
MSETWLDTAAAPDLGGCVAAAQQVGAHVFNAYIGGRYSGGSGWTPDLVAQLAGAGYGVFGSWVALRPGQGGYGLGHQDGLDAAATARAYPAIRVLSYDVEPGAWDANPAGATEATIGFTDAVHSAGYLSMPYSVWRGLAAGGQGADFVWAANPGNCDPAAQPVAGDFFPGRRSVQCSQIQAAGRDWDVSYSQFSITGGGGVSDAMTNEEQVASLTAHVVTAYVAFVHHYPNPDEIKAWVDSARPYDPAGMVTRIMQNLDAAGTAYVPVTEPLVAAEIKAALAAAPPGSTGLVPHHHGVALSTQSGGAVAE